MHLAPPCGTSSAARNKPIPQAAHHGAPVPQPLRSTTEPQGLSTLVGVDLLRVLQANALYEAVGVIVRHCIALGVRVSVENPLNSLAWLCDGMEARLPPPRHRGKTEAREEQELYIAYPRRSGGLGYNRGLATLVAGLGFFPTTGRGALVNTPGTTVATSTSQPRKQAWIRAQQQASRHGQAWYRGRLVRSVMDPRTIVQSPPPRRSARRGPQHTKRGATARLQVMTLNVGLFLVGRD